MENIILAHDFGTTGDKATLFSTKGEIISSYYTPYKTYYPCPGWAEQDPNEWKTAFKTSTEMVLAAAKLRPSNISVVSFSGHMLGCIPVDKDGLVLREKAILWADHRSQREAEFINQTIGWSSFYHTTGGGLELALYPAAKILWMKKNEPEIYEKAYKFLGTKDLIVQWLTGKFVTDFSDASNTGLFDINKRKWARDIIKALGLDIAKLPDNVFPSTELIGTVTSVGAGESGLPQGLPVVLGGGDVPCAAVGAGVVNPGSIYTYIGSASWVATATQRPVFDSGMRPFNLCHLVPDRYVTQLATYSAGVVYEWFRDQFYSPYDKKAFQIMDKDAGNSEPGSRGLLFLPYMRAGGAPFHDLGAHGALLGLTLAHNRADVIRAVLEGISLNIKLLIDSLENNLNISFSEVRLIGGGAKSKLWRTILADVLNKTVVTSAVSQEANSLGAGIVGGVGVGLFNDFANAVEMFIKTHERSEPRKENTKIYQQLTEIFIDVYRKVSEAHQLLGGLTTGQTANG